MLLALLMSLEFATKWGYVVSGDSSSLTTIGNSGATRWRHLILDHSLRLHGLLMELKSHVLEALAPSFSATSSTGKMELLYFHSKHT